MLEIAFTRLKLWVLELEYFLIDTDKHSLVQKLRSERKEHQLAIAQLRREHEPWNHEDITEALEGHYTDLLRIDDILDHKYRYRDPMTGYDVQFAWWER